jgi:predicted transcriptional regulator
MRHPQKQKRKHNGRIMKSIVDSIASELQFSNGLTKEQVVNLLGVTAMQYKRCIAGNSQRVMQIMHQAIDGLSETNTHIMRISDSINDKLTQIDYLPETRGRKRNGTKQCDAATAETAAAACKSSGVHNQPAGDGQD